MPGSIDIVDPYDALHGVIRFYRKIRIPRFTKSKKQELKEKLKQSGINFSGSLEEALEFF